MFTRRGFLQHAALTAAGVPLCHGASEDRVAPYRTPYKYPKLILGRSEDKAAFDAKSVDDPIVFSVNGSFHMLYIGFDGTGYQTGLASSSDLVHWTRTALVGPRDAASRYNKYNLAISSILRDKNLNGTGEAIKVNGRYIAAWNAYPSPGYEEGAAVIGLARSTDLLHWSLSDPILDRMTERRGSTGGCTAPTSSYTTEPTSFTTTRRPISCLRLKGKAGTNRAVSLLVEI